MHCQCRDKRRRHGVNEINFHIALADVELKVAKTVARVRHSTQIGKGKKRNYDAVLMEGRETEKKNGYKGKSGVDLQYNGVEREVADKARQGNEEPRSCRTQVEDRGAAMIPQRRPV